MRDIVANGKCGENVFWEITEDGIITINGNGQMENYRYYNRPWKEYISAIKKCVIVDGVKRIGSHAFWGCENMEEIVIPESVVSIFNGAFCMCRSLRDINIPNGIDVIGYHTFSACHKLKSVIIPASVTYIDVDAFSFCHNLNEITFLGNAPSFRGVCFYDVRATAYYPANNPTWTDYVKQNYGGNITWVAV